MNLLKFIILFAGIVFIIVACSNGGNTSDVNSSSSLEYSSSIEASSSSSLEISSSSSMEVSSSSSIEASSSSSLEVSSSSSMEVSSSSSMEVSSSSSIKVSSSSSKTASSSSLASSSSVAAAANSFDVYIAFGQSNMQGPAEIRAQDKEVNERFQVLNVVAGTYAKENRAKGQWYKAVPPLIIPDANLVNYLGLNIGLSPANYFGVKLVEKAPENIKIGVIPVASGDLALAAFHKTRGDQYYNKQNVANGRPSDTEMSGMKRYKDAGYANLYDAIIKNAKIAQNGGGIIKGIIVHQGESGVGQTGITWANMLKEIYEDILKDLGLEANSIPIVLGQLWNSGTGPDGLLNLDNRIQNTIPKAYVVSTKDCGGRTGNGQPDNIHFGSAGIQLLGERYGEKMFEMVYKLR
ncbi:MAG: sialate O-acetylesterase [Fibromonadaceae bacterium]|jgi:hypothetical protein|nr:sialate O-acetylesterase [Fibromonadaceae bacterium]